MEPTDRRPGLALVAVLVLVVAAVVLAGWLVRAGEPEGLVAAPREQGRTDPAAVLRAWDVRRASAWADGNVVALQGLYVPHAAAGRADVRMLREYLRRGLTVDRMAVQLLRLRVTCQTPGRLCLLVTDRLVGAVAVGETGHVRLPADRPTVRRVVLRRWTDGWRVSRVLPAG